MKRMAFIAGPMLAVLAVAAAVVFLARPPGATGKAGDMAALRALAANASPEQHDALADGWVTVSEYEAALGRVAACARVAGIDATVIPGSGLWPARLDYAVPDAAGDPAVIAVAQARIDACEEEHGRYVMMGWELQRTPSPAVLAAMYERMEACIAGGGAPQYAAQARGVVNAAVYDGAPQRAVDVPVSAIQAYNECTFVIQEETGLLAPPARIHDRPARD